MATTRQPASPLAALVQSIREYQTQFSLTDELLAERLGVPRTTWTMLRNGHYSPSLEFAQKVRRLPEFRRAAEAVLVPELT